MFCFVCLFVCLFVCFFQRSVSTKFSSNFLIFEFVYIAERQFWKRYSWAILGANNFFCPPRPPMLIYIIKRKNDTTDLKKSRKEAQWLFRRFQIVLARNFATFKWQSQKKNEMLGTMEPPPLCTVKYYTKKYYITFSIPF